MKSFLQVPGFWVLLLSHGLPALSKVTIGKEAVGHSGKCRRPSVSLSLLQRSRQSHQQLQEPSLLQTSSQESEHFSAPDASFFSDYADAESTWDVDGEVVKEENGFDDLPGSANIVMSTQQPSSWFYETESAGSMQAWQTFNRKQDLHDPAWMDKEDGRLIQDFFPVADNPAPARGKAAPWFEHSIEAYDTFGRPRTPTMQSERYYVETNWTKMNRSVPLTCGPPGCEANTTLQVLGNTSETEYALCRLSVLVHSTDFDDEYSRERIEWLVVNGKEVLRDFSPRAEKSCQSPEGNTSAEGNGTSGNTSTGNASTGNASNKSNESSTQDVLDFDVPKNTSNASSSDGNSSPINISEFVRAALGMNASNVTKNASNASNTSNATSSNATNASKSTKPNASKSTKSNASKSTKSNATSKQSNASKGTKLLAMAAAPGNSSSQKAKSSQKAETKSSEKKTSGGTKSGSDASGTAELPLYPILRDLPLKGLLDKDGKLDISGKISAAVDECPVNGNHLSGVVIATCFTRPVPPLPAPATTGAPKPPVEEPEDFKMNDAADFSCKEPGCNTTVYLYVDSFNASERKCKLTVRLNETDFEAGDGTNEAIERLQVDGENLSTKEQPSKNPCREAMEAKTERKYEVLTLVKDQDVTKAAADGNVTLSIKISDMVDECGVDGNLLYGRAELSCS